MSANESTSQLRQNRWAWMWLAYTGFLLIEPLVEPTLNLWLGTVACLLVFFGIFWRFFYTARPSQP